LRNDLFGMGHGHCESDWGHGRGAECSPHNATADRTRARDAADIGCIAQRGIAPTTANVYMYLDLYFT
jgi:hypothetical protein